MNFKKLEIGQWEDRSTFRICIDFLSLVFLSCTLRIKPILCITRWTGSSTTKKHPFQVLVFFLFPGCGKMARRQGSLIHPSVIHLAPTGKRNPHNGPMPPSTKDTGRSSVMLMIPPPLLFQYRSELKNVAGLFKFELPFLLVPIQLGLVCKIRKTVLFNQNSDRGQINER